MRAKGSLRRNAVTLALAGGIEYGLQLAIPIILVRCLDQTTFGQYRLLWLLAATTLAIAPAFMPQSLFYFLPRAQQADKPLVIGNVLVYLLAAACMVGLVTVGWNPMLPESAKILFFQTHGATSIFLALWIIASLLDVLPTADGRASWQAKTTTSIAIFRTVVLLGAALLTADITWLVASLMIVATVKIMCALYYAYAATGEHRIVWDAVALKRQLSYALPFAVGNGLFLLRSHADEWVVASMLTPAMYATFSIAAVFMPLATLIRQPVNNAMMPRLNSAHASGDLAEIARLIVKSNGATALLLIPIVGGLLATTPEIVEIIYTSRYSQTAPVMQVYLIGTMMTTFAVGHVLSAIDKGRFSAINNFFCLIISIIISIVGVMQWGMIGAALGSVVTLALSELWSVAVVARALGMRMMQLLAWRVISPVALGTCLALSGVTLLDDLIKGNVWMLLFAKGIGYFILYSIFFLVTGGKKHFSLFAKV